MHRQPKTNQQNNTLRRKLTIMKGYQLLPSKVSTTVLSNTSNRPALKDIKNCHLHIPNQVPRRIKSTSDDATYVISVPHQARERIRSEYGDRSSPIIINRTYCASRTVEPSRTSSALQRVVSERYQVPVAPNRTCVKFQPTPHSPIKPNLFRSANTFITENFILRRSPKVQRRSVPYYCPLDSDSYRCEYITDMYVKSRMSEKTALVKPGYLKYYNPNPEARNAIVHWVLKTQKYLHFNQTNYYAAVRIIDMVLGSIAVPTNMYQLLSIAALTIVFKINGFTDYSVAHLLSLCGSCYIKAQLYEMERKIMRVLDYRITTNDLTFFVDYYIFKLRLQNNQLVETAVFYTLDCLSLSPEFSTIEISAMAAAAINFVLRKLHLHRNNIFDHFPDLNSQLLLIVQQKIAEQVLNMVDRNYVFREPYAKYCGKNKLHVALIV